MTTTVNWRSTESELPPLNTPLWGAWPNSSEKLDPQHRTGWHIVMCVYDESGWTAEYPERINILPPLYWCLYADFYPKGTNE